MIIDDTDTNPGAEGDNTPTATEVTEPETETEGAESEVEETNPDDELEDFEYEGKTAKLPKWVKPLTMMQSDYTKKTQEVAETRKSYEAKVAAIAQREQAFQQDAQEYAQLVAIDQAIKQYEQLIPQLRQQGQSDAANRHWQDLMEMRNAAGRLSLGLQQKQQHRQAEAEREHANRMKERDAALAREISGFSPTLMSKIQDYAVSDGYTSDEAQSLIDPRYVKTLNKARMWDEHVAKAKAAAKQVKQQETPEPAPTPIVQARKPNPNRLSDNLSTEEWMKRRNAAVARR